MHSCLQKDQRKRRVLRWVRVVYFVLTCSRNAILAIRLNLEVFFIMPKQSLMFAQLTNSQLLIVCAWIRIAQWIFLGLALVLCPIMFVLLTRQLSPNWLVYKNSVHVCFFLAVRYKRMVKIELMSANRFDAVEPLSVCCRLIQFTYN